VHPDLQDEEIVGPLEKSWDKMKWTKIKIISPATGAIANLRWFGADSPNWGTAVELYAGLESSYAQSTAAVVNTSAATIASSYTAAGPLTVNAGTVATTTSGTTGTQDYVCSQVRVTSTASAGISAAQSYTYRSLFLDAFWRKPKMNNVALTGKPKSSKKIRQSRMVNQVIEKAIYRLIGSPKHKCFGNTKSSFYNELNATHPLLRMKG